MLELTNFPMQVLLVCETQQLKSLSVDFEYECEKCTVQKQYNKVEIKVDYDQPRPYSIQTSVTLTKDQNVRLSVDIVDFISSVLADSDISQFDFNVTLQE